MLYVWETADPTGQLQHRLKLWKLDQLDIERGTLLIYPGQKFLSGLTEFDFNLNWLVFGKLKHPQDNGL